MTLACRIIFILCFLASYSASAQDEDKECGKTTNKKALQLLNDAKKEHNWDKCREKIDAALEEESQFPEAYLFLANRLLKRNNLQMSLKLKKTEVEENIRTIIEAYNKLIEICPDFSVDPYLNLGEYYFEKKQYEDAIKYLKSVRKFEKVRDTDLSYADSLLRVAKLLKSPVPFDPKPVNGICSSADEYLPIISADNEVAFYTRAFDKVRRGDLIPSRVEEFTYSLSDTVSGVFDSGKMMPNPFNMSNNEGGASVSIDNNHLFFTICKAGSGYTNCDIYYCDRVNGRWGEVKNLGENINSPKAWDSQPCISRDGTTLYFASDRNPATGADIYVTKKTNKGNWSEPEPLGMPVNTRGNEKSPFIHPDDRTLYFSSDGQAGMGGFDIFYSKKDSAGKWGTPKNIGYPINSTNDELGFFVSTDGKTGYFASNKLKGKGGWDVYSFPLYEAARPDRVLFVKGELEKDPSDTNDVMANIEMINIKTKEITKLNVDSTTGKYVGVVNFKDDYLLTMKREGYAFESQYYTAQDSTIVKPVKVDIPLKKIEVGAVFTLKNIYYKSNSAELEDGSKFVVQEFVKFLEESPKVKVEIRGHTDNVGDDKKNLALSTDRAFTVYDLLLQAGVNKSRISFKGFGKAKPIAPNDSEENKAKNRRTEFVIVAK